MLTLAGSCLVAAVAVSDLTLVANRYADDLAAEPVVGTAVSRLAETLKPDGSWPDVDYESKARSGWVPGLVHLSRQQTLAAAYRRTGGPSCLAASRQALAFWIDRDFRCPNWWWNDIGVPHALAATALCLGDQTPDEARTWIVRRLAKVELGVWTGQNRTWLAENHLFRALLTHDVKLAQAAIDVIYGEIRLSDCEGIRSDWCFHQHGRQPQFGNYGRSFIDQQSRYAEITSGTELAMPPDKFEMLCNLAERGFAWTIWKGSLDVAAVGRQLTPDCSRIKAASILRSLDRLERAGWKRPQGPVGFRYFDQSAYAVFRTGSWMASVKASTPSIVGTETWVNEDNALGMCMADGALYVYRTGDEYRNVFPLWKDWRMVPGVTGYVGKPVDRSRLRNEVDDMRAASKDGTDVLSLAFRREGLSVRKRWTFTEREILCEGEGISAADGDFEVATCVEQAIAQDDAACVSSGEALSCYVNGGIRYVVEAPREAIDFSVEGRTGDFSAFMRSMRPTPAAGRVFSLRIRHGRRPSGASYRYRIIPEANHEQ